MDKHGKTMRLITWINNNEAIGVIIIMKLNLTTSLLTGLLVSGHVSAQLLEEITVTAQKREQSIQDVGIAVTAFSGDQLQALGVTDNTDIAAFSPGVFISANNGGINQQFTIRGVTQNDNFSIAESPNALYIDEGYRPIVSQLSTAFDVERVEVLKGPQATLFGRNATGGMIHYISKKPTKETEGYLDLTYGDYNQMRVEGAVGGPLSDSVSMRLSGIYRRTDPIMDNEFSTSSLNDLTFNSPGGPFVGASPNIDNDDAWAENQYALRAQMQFYPRDDLSILVKVEDEKSRPNSNPYGSLATVAVIEGPGPGTIINALVSNSRTNPNSCEALQAGTTNCRNLIPPLDGDFDGVRPVPNGDLFGYVDNVNDLDVSHSFAFDNSNISESTGLNVKINWFLDWAELVSVTTYADSFKRQALDLDAGPAPFLSVSNYGDIDWLTQELRLEGKTDNFRWIAGLYYLEIDGEAGNAVGDNIGGSAAVAFNPAVVGSGGGPGNFIEISSEGSTDTTSFSIFGQIDYDLTNKLELTLGWRGTQEKKDFDGNTGFYTNNSITRVDGIRSGAAELANLNSHSESLDDFLWSGVAKLNYRPTDDLLLYGGVTRGVKAGGCNAPLFNAAIVSPDQYCYDEEVLLSYEAGFKATVWDGKARINGTAYYYDYDGYQAFLFEGASGIVSNADATYKGAELEILAAVTDQLDVILGISYVDATVESLAVAPGIIRDVDPTFTPDLQFNFVGRYTWPDALYDGAITLQVDGNYAASSYHNLSNFDATEMDSYWLSNANLSWKSADDRWQLTGFVDNLFDERNQTTGFSLHGISGGDEVAFGLPRMYGVRIRYNYF